jgi:hypothetical protein
MAVNLIVKEDSPEEYKEFLRKTAEIADFILKTLAESELAYGDLDNEKEYNYNVISEKIINEIVAKDIKYSEFPQIFKALLQPLEEVKQRVAFSKDMALDKAMEKLLEKPLTDVTYKELVEVVRK